jgi:hypothetical protein
LDNAGIAAALTIKKENSMTLPAQTLTAIQAAGAAVYVADVALKEAVQSYAEQVKRSMLENPFDLGNDGLFDDWKTVARLSRAVEQVEAEFQKIYRAASDLANGAAPTVLTMPTLSAPEAAGSAGLAMVQAIDATDVTAKKQKKTVKISVKNAGSTMAKPASSKPLAGNAAKLLTRLLAILNPNHFVKINQSLVGAEIGLPKGSVGASITRLLETGHLIAGGSGEYKLGVPKSR